MTDTTQTPIAAPTPKAVDAMILEHAAAQSCLQSGGAIQRQPGESAAALELRFKAWQTNAAEFRAAAQVKADEVKGRLLAMVAAHGTRHAEKSMRLVGEHNRATVTTGTRVETKPEGVEAFKTALEKSEIAGIADLFFIKHVTYSMVAGPAAVLETLELGTRLRNRLAGLAALCFKVATMAPALKIESTAAAKPRRTEAA